MDLFEENGVVRTELLQKHIEALSKIQTEYCKPLLEAGWKMWEVDVLLNGVRDHTSCYLSLGVPYNGNY